MLASEGCGVCVLSCGVRRGGLLWVAPGLAAADFSELVTVCLGRGGIDGGSCFGDLGGGEPGGPTGRGNVLSNLPVLTCGIFREMARVLLAPELVGFFLGSVVNVVDFC